MKIVKVIFLNLIVLFLLIEGASYLYFKLGLSISNYKPSYVSNANDTEQQWMTEFNPWGAWHKANGRGYKELKCFGVELIANSYGARDKERNLKSGGARVVVLGDSFVEGFGVEASKRFTDKLEKLTNHSFLNFGTSGDFGPLQYSILYKELASQFNHERVLVSILPDNDFTDNDPAYWQKANESGFKKRYRPYWKKQNGERGFSHFYNVKRPEHELTFEDYRGEDQKRGISFKNKMQRLTWSYGVYRELRYYTRGSSITAGTYSGYFDYTKEQLEATFFYLNEIKKTANGKPVYFFTIPRLSDFKRLQSEPSPMVLKMKQFAKTNGFHYIDLTEGMLSHTKKIPDLFLPCDGHWSEKGHAVASEVLYNELFKK
ncbi:SGNH/GDSL hydrolase family protein [Terasakiella pusilla]|uniref:SGNH/GDSL hydrolase family protein n=1 Tax=Terasakiella pusilla TaxID=64973 RepID=UPI00048B5040|nr:SGNH/GDSL hydrolase family protein [Terasakiella pusilla]